MTRIPTIPLPSGRKALSGTAAHFGAPTGGDDFVILAKNKAALRRVLAGSNWLGQPIESKWLPAILVSPDDFQPKEKP